jgi:hypothetical protein
MWNNFPSLRDLPWWGYLIATLILLSLTGGAVSQTLSYIRLRRDNPLDTPIAGTGTEHPEFLKHTVTQCPHCDQMPHNFEVELSRFTVQYASVAGMRYSAQMGWIYSSSLMLWLLNAPVLWVISGAVILLIIATWLYAQAERPLHKLTDQENTVILYCPTTNKPFESVITIMTPLSKSMNKVSISKISNV